MVERGLPKKPCYGENDGPDMPEGFRTKSGVTKPCNCAFFPPNYGLDSEYLRQGEKVMLVKVPQLIASGKRD